MFGKIIPGLLIAAVVGLGSPAVAQSSYGAQTDVGFITDVDLEDRKVTLSSGATYIMPAGFNLKSFNDGQKVRLTWDQVGGSKLGKSIEFTN